MGFLLSKCYFSASVPYSLRINYTPRNFVRFVAVKMATAFTGNRLAVIMNPLIILKFMAKGSQFWGNASGKLGEQVLYRAGGEQRARTYVAKIKNPRSYAQMKNRLLMLNVVSAFRTLKPLLSESFPNRKANQSAFNAFVQANKQTTGFYIAKEDLESGACVPYGMTIAKGSMGISLQPTLQKIEHDADPDASANYGWVVDGLLDLNNFEYTVKASEDLGDSHWLPLTVEQLAEIMKSQSIVQLPSQFQLSVASAYYASEDSDMGNDMWQLGFDVFHCQALNSYSRHYGMERSDYKMKIYLHVKSRTFSTDEEFKTYTFDKLVVGPYFLTADDASNYACACVLSFKENGKYSVSNSKFGVVPARIDGRKVEDPTADYVEGGFYFEQVMESYGYKTDGILASTISDKPAVEEEEDEELEGGV